MEGMSDEAPRAGGEAAAQGAPTDDEHVEGSGAGAPPEDSRPQVTGAGHMIDLEFLRGLIEAIDQSGIDSLEISRGGTRIRLSKTPPSTGVVLAQPPAGQPAAAVATASAETPVAEPTAPATPEKELIDIKSPMVGTFYRGPAPEAPPYVEPGAPVTKGQTLCILEAMKLMNELQSEFDGIIREVLVENAEPVEYGQVLFRIEPTG